jgi:hypothetical protein
MILNKYSEFLILEKALNESVLYISPPVKKILKKINNKISNKILDSEKVSIKPDITFIDIGKDGYFSFTTMRNAIKNLSKNFSEISKELTDDENYLTTKIADEVYRIDSLDNLEEKPYIYINSRNDVSIGRFINKAFPKEFDNKEVEEFVNMFKSYIIGTSEKFEIVEGNDIAKWYDGDLYKSMDGTLGNSCMARKKNFFDIYTENADVCRMLILTENDELIGRALIWKVEYLKRNREELKPLKDNKDIFFMDRQYTIEDSDVEKFRNYAKEQGWYYKSANNHHSYESVSDGIESFNGKMIVKVNAKEYNKYPYLDTFRRYDKNEGILYNDNNKDNEYAGMYILDRTDGDFDEIIDGVWSDYHDEYISRDVAVYSEYLQDYIHEDVASMVEKGRYEGTYVHSDSSYFVWSEYEGGMLHVEDATYSKIMHSYIYNDESKYIITGVTTQGYVSYPYDDPEYFIVPSDYDCLDIHKVYNYYWYKKLSDSDDDWSNYEGIHNDLIIKNYRDEYILNRFKIEIFKTFDNEYDLPYLIKEDAIILGIKLKTEEPYVYDAVTYYGDISKVRNELIRKGEKKIKYNDSIISGIQKTIEFEDNNEYFIKLQSINDLISNRIRIIKNDEYI